MKTEISGKPGRNPAGGKVVARRECSSFKVKIPSGGTVTVNMKDLMSGQELDTATMDTIITSGFGACTVYMVKSELGLNNRYLAQTMGMSEKTLIRRSESNEKLSPVESDRLYRIMRIFNVAIKALNDKDAAKKWLHRPQRGLGGRVPMDAIQTEPGAVEVENLLGRIEHGVYS